MSISVEIVDDDLVRLTKPLKYREFFKKSPKSSPSSFQYYFLSQELSVSDDPNDNISINNNTTAGGGGGGAGDITPTTEYSRPTRKAIGNTKTFHNKANFILKFSHDGKFLASAGDDGIIRIWEVISSNLDRDHECKARQLSIITSGIDESEIHDPDRKSSDSKKNNSSSNNTSAPFAPVFKQKPVKLFKHDDTILSLDWSKNGFLISSSQDMTIKLWHIERDDCLTVFNINSFATCVLFHKTDDRFFISCHWDGSVNFWSILEKQIEFKQNFNKKKLTCMDFSIEYNLLFIGGDNGYVYILNGEDLQLISDFQIKRKNKTPRVTGIEIFQQNENDLSLLVSTNDSRVRLLSYHEKSLKVRFKGYGNEHSTINATISDDHSHVIAGSEDGWAYIWSVEFEKLNQLKTDKHKKFQWNDITSLFKEENCLLNNGYYGAFHVHHSRCNVALFAPRSTSKLLELSNDPIFDLYSKADLLQNGQQQQQQQHEKHEVDDLATGIIVTTDNTGVIRVFRKDFAHSLRKQFSSLKKQSGRKSLSMVRNNSGSASRRKSSILINGGSRSGFDTSSFQTDESRGRLQYTNGDQSSISTKTMRGKSMLGLSKIDDGDVLDGDNLQDVDHKLKLILLNNNNNNNTTGGEQSTIGNDSYDKTVLTFETGHSEERRSSKDYFLLGNGVQQHHALTSTPLKNSIANMQEVGDSPKTNTKTKIETGNGNGNVMIDNDNGITRYEGQGNEDNRSLNSLDTNKTKIQCNKCGGLKFTANGVNDNLGVLFYCDSCGHRMDVQ
ncbi:hypothetical protein CANARDRAFT_15611 [[Candida] arabinofermentans NRRL YB-2248]|uniref:Uncharacterized protein n=1 Tax=[Candida] arabinofermentans NRRL YB-2248 TaxID=983967 RepID=A0A1E4T5W2_9ASCO|nr:hypothetical protein CANARDRAFT_15611 [[Candida] arabinofermentans NRRL YB-2248]